MKFTIYKNVRSQSPELLTAEKFAQVAGDAGIKRICERIARTADHEEQQKLKKGLPVVTWQAWFEGARKNDAAHPNGLFMLDVDGVDDPYALWCGIADRCEELGVMLAHKTPSTHGLRLVCRCRKEFATIDECQRWLAKEIGVKHDAACKDWARSSYMVPEDYLYFIDKKLFSDEAVVLYGNGGSSMPRVSAAAANRPESSKEEGELLFKGIPLQRIAKELLLATGGEPVEGERNTRLHALACEMRYITDFDEGRLLSVLPRYGLSEEEMRSLIHSACNASRLRSMPKKLEEVLQRLSEPETADDEEDDILTVDARLGAVPMPTLPPLIRQLCSTAPDDFKVAVVLCVLPLLGTLGSKLRARYLDGHLHSPSFQVSLEAPQASGKSFMNRLAEMLLSPVLKRDEESRQEEQKYVEKVAEMKLTGIKVTPENKDELLGHRPKGIIRYVPATISITKLLMRLDNARGLHLCAVCEEIDTVTKAFKRGFSSYGDLLRVAFDNGRYGQDYASDNSYSGIVNVYYNTLFSGTPKAMCRFYPDVEDGLVSRVCFVSLPDQFGKPIPRWNELSEKDRKEVERQIDRLDRVSIVDDTVQPDYEMNLDFLNRAMELWVKRQQQEAVRTEDRTRDTFCRRAAVVGFRAGMLAWFLYGEKNIYGVRRKTVDFACWVAGQMLNQHMMRFQINDTGSNTSRWEKVYKQLGEEFTREELQKVLCATGTQSSVKQVVHQWGLQGSIEVVEEGRSISGKRQAVRFRKVKG